MFLVSVQLCGVLRRIRKSKSHTRDTIQKGTPPPEQHHDTKEQVLKSIKRQKRNLNRHLKQTLDRNRSNALEQSVASVTVALKRVLHPHLTGQPTRTRNMFFSLQ